MCQLVMFFVFSLAERFFRGGPPSTPLPRIYWPDAVPSALPARVGQLCTSNDKSQCQWPDERRDNGSRCSTPWNSRLMLPELVQQLPLPADTTNVLSSPWQQWLTSSVKRLADASLLRSLHPVHTTPSPIEVPALSACTQIALSVALGCN